MPDILLLHGPNLNLLGTREPGIYGACTLEEINHSALSRCTAVGARLETLQSNSESELISRVQLSGTDGTRFIVINPAAFTHTSVALRDALAAVGLPFIEVHLSNVHAREPFRRQSFFSDLAQAVVCGLGPRGYETAVDVALEQIGFRGAPA
ncbi:MAG TPA: type II 3-dehydroquinate dehydratase [Gammaproteobacteria bacterium]|jgi:3-dehydroquinate dehydratase-2|nr:type II 3-dehydroquinate dehydratase [Acidiferrobacteraceae bacterium]MDP6552154.1 type II 3-dehydroquinate dehydratase [Arenicellales bacterium]MDP6792208.1 type II 3-dehydroquinate dehydratase [Arenicellales bacterium]MDP6919992.1 type II 3-dehydroquinate dehydratase [Arenicellales bacterium]HCX88840.1 type II 3-dehydroquinate dehydratase [Gammaproteobacteria bacterium]|tara:strand:+ start:7509 stop:7964 length:456 start_codon:yes stop_codon:yes gene_type:complete